MYKDQFSAMLAIIVPPIIEQITKLVILEMKKPFPYFINLKSIRNCQMKNPNCGTIVR